MLEVEPISYEIVEAVFQFSQITKKPIIISCPKSQVDYEKSTFLSTFDFMNLIHTKRAQYTDAQVYVSRKNCNIQSNLTDSYKTLEYDCRAGFDILHLDFFTPKLSSNEIIFKTLSAMKYARILSPNIVLGVSIHDTNINYIQETLAKYEDFSPTFCTVPTGSKVLDGRQMGNFDYSFINKLSNYIHPVVIRDTNSDFLTRDEINQRRGLVISLSEELGIAQSEQLFSQAENLGLNLDPFIKAVNKKKLWKNKINLISPDDAYNCALLTAHNDFYSKEYQVLKKRINFNINAFVEILSKYLPIY